MQYPLANYYGYRQTAAPPANMSSFFEQDAKGYFFDMECPELTGSESSQSPAGSCFTSGGALTPPSPCLDAKDPTVAEDGMQAYSSFSDLSPLSSFGDSCLNMNPSWSEQPAAVSYDTSSQYISSMWSCSQYAPAQPFFNTTGHISAASTQPQADGLFASSVIQEMPSATASHLPSSIGPSLQQNMATRFIGFEAEGLVAPGHLFNTTLDKFTFVDTKPVLFSTQPMIEDSLAFEPLPSTNELDMPSQPVEQAVRYVPEVTRNNRDEYLQEARRRGLSYKEIKRRGGFTEAESTLRGRIRILSKPKEMRVRKPQWNRSDVCPYICFVSQPYLTKLHRSCSSLKQSNISPKHPRNRRLARATCVRGTPRASCHGRRSPSGCSPTVHHIPSPVRPVPRSGSRFVRYPSRSSSRST